MLASNLMKPETQSKRPKSNLLFAGRSCLARFVSSTHGTPLPAWRLYHPSEKDVPIFIERTTMTVTAFCGLNCEECPAFQATANNSREHQTWLAAEYSSNDQVYSPMDMICFGCHSSQGFTSHMCRTCAVRQCARDKVNHTCAECPDYPCTLIERYIPLETDSRNQLDFAHACQAA